VQLQILSISTRSRYGIFQALRGEAFTAALPFMLKGELNHETSAIGSQAMYLLSTLRIKSIVNNPIELFDV